MSAASRLRGGWWWSRATNIRLRWSQERSGSDFAFCLFTFAFLQNWPPADAGGSD